MQYLRILGTKLALKDAAVIETNKAEKPLLYGQRPIVRPDGIEYYIDPETGAKHFKIERTKPTL